MDMQKIGYFLSQLRKEREMTQEQLGEKLGVTNKTISRWETGTYLPPVEMLQMLSEMYGITINEILSGQRLSEQAYREKAEENIKTALSESAFTLKEKVDYYEKKWTQDHRMDGIVGFILILVGIVVLEMLVEEIGAVIGFGIGMYWLTRRRNEKRAYIEERAFDGSGNQ